MNFTDKGFCIKAEIWGKTLYWEQHYGLHAGTVKLQGYSVYNTEAKAKYQIKKLQACFAKAVIFTVIPESELPFIKKQIIANKRKDKLAHKILTFPGKWRTQRGHVNKLTKSNY